MAVSLRGEDPLQAEGVALPIGSELAEEFIQVNAGGTVYKTGMAPVSPSMQCVISLTVQYFVVYLGLQIAMTYNQFRPENKTSLESVFSNATSTVNFCPMLAILFIGVRMRAVQLGVTPQPWAQAWMFICTYSILGQTILALIGGWLLPDQREEHQGGRGRNSSGILNWIVS